MENLVKKPLIDGRTLLVDDLSEEVDQSFMDMYSNNPLEKTLAAPESDIFGIYDRAVEYNRLMDATEEIMKVDVNEEIKIPSNVDRCFRHSNHHSHDSDSWISKKVPNVELKQLPAGLKYAFLYDNSFPVIVNAD